MLKSEATVKTELASRYLQQLCKHWGHHFSAEFTPEKGTIKFADDRICNLAAENGVLRMTLEMPDEAVQAQMQNAVFAHVKRFAFKEELADPVWASL
jgi:uncharacterized protein